MLLFIASLLNKKTSLYLPSGTVQSKIKKSGFYLQFGDSLRQSMSDFTYGVCYNFSIHDVELIGHLSRVEFEQNLAA
jgi:hypothetical protein